jgi:prepilin-type N-terminal cleavage/methylation domain-containing protein
MKKQRKAFAVPTTHAAARRRAPAGFTLIELSIVLVVIGLIVGGVLAGREMIRQAEIRSVISEELRLQTAVATFKGKYDCLPGDCPNPSTFGIAPFPNAVMSSGGIWGVVPTPGVANGGVGIPGNGDGIIDNSAGNLFEINGEMFLFWWQLSQTGLISEPYQPAGNVSNGCSDTAVASYIPSSMPNNNWWVGYSPMVAGQNGLASNAFLLTGVSTTVGNNNSCGGSMFSNGLTPADALAIDTKLDDGLPMSGWIRAISGGATYALPVHNTTVPNFCTLITLTAWANTTQNNAANCSLAFKFSQ